MVERQCGRSVASDVAVDEISCWTFNAFVGNSGLLALSRRMLGFHACAALERQTLGRRSPERGRIVALHSWTATGGGAHRIV